MSAESPPEARRIAEAARLVADGLVVLDDALSAEFVLELRDAFVPLLEAYVASPAPIRPIPARRLSRSIRTVTHYSRSGVSVRLSTACR